MMSEEKPTPRHSLKREIPGLLFLFLAVMLFLSLVSYNPTDPSLTTFSTSDEHGRIANYIGLVGANFSSVAVDLFGLGAFWTVLVLLGLSYRCFKGRPFVYPRLVGIGLFLLLLTSTAALAMIFPRLEHIWPETLGGGLIGDLLGRYLVQALNPIGAGLLVGSLFLVALILATGLSLIGAVGSLFQRFRHIQGDWEEIKVKKQEKAERSKKFKENQEKVKDRPEPKVKEKKAPPAPKPKQEIFEFPTPEGEYTLPLVELLDEAAPKKGGMARESMMANARLVEKKLADFNVSGEVSEVSTGPVITMYEYQPAPGIKISKVAGLTDDLAMNMRAEAIRVVPSIPGKAAIGIEIPNPKREFVNLREVVVSDAFAESKSLLTLVLGVDTMGHPEVADLARMPHLLIAGATGSGKSVGLNAIIMSILYKAKPDQVRFLMIDPKRIELTLYRDLPHLIYPVVSDPKDATQALKWAVADMEHRYQLLAEKGVRNIEAYNKKIRKEAALKPAAPPPPPPPPEDPDLEDPDLEEGGLNLTASQAEPETPPEPLPYLVIIIDELADLMMVSAKDVETYITRLAQMARAAGIHLILATQRPSVDVLTGVIKANLPTRISFQVSSKIDSRTILDTMGAEKLLGMGDMLFLPPGTSKIRRIHGAYVSEEEIKRVTDFIKAQATANYLEDLTVPSDESEEGGSEEDYDDKYDEAVQLVTKAGKASISLIQRHLRIGYNRAARIIEIMERDGVVGPADGAKPRQVLAREL